MADFRGIAGAGAALVHLFQSSYTEDVLDNELAFRLSSREDVANGAISAGVSVFLYRVVANGASRTPPGRPGALGTRRVTELPLDLHYLLTFWGGEPSLQHGVAGWAMRLLEDTPVLPYGHLEAASPGVFSEGEQLEVIAGELSNEDLFQLWEALAPERGYELSATYLVRNIRIESAHSVSTGPVVRERGFEVATS